MRCNTPNMRRFSKGLATKLPASLYFIKGNQFKNMPIPNISSERVIIFFQKAPSPAASNFGITKAMALPTANKKKGKTKIGWCNAMPACMCQRRKHMAPAAGIVYQYHECHGGATKNIEGVEALIHLAVGRLNLKVTQILSLNSSQRISFSSSNCTMVLMRSAAFCRAS